MHIVCVESPNYSGLSIFAPRRFAFFVLQIEETALQKDKEFWILNPHANSIGPFHTHTHQAKFIQNFTDPKNVPLSLLSVVVSILRLIIYIFISDDSIWYYVNSKKNHIFQIFLIQKYFLPFLPIFLYFATDSIFSYWQFNFGLCRFWKV